jgi:hypothetical protein
VYLPRIYHLATVSTSALSLLKANWAYFSQRAAERMENLAASFRADGISGIASKVTEHVRWFRNIRQRDTEFDLSLGVDTVGPVELWRFRIPSANVQHAKRYQAIDPGVLRQALASVKRDFQEFTFIDVGCGKGRALLIAAEHKFKGLIGVEFASQLTHIAEDNCRRVGVAATILYQDAATYRFPTGNLVLYLFNPFGPDVLNPVLDNLLASQIAASSVCYVIYVNPEYRECLDQRPQISSFDVQPLYAIWKVSSCPAQVAVPGANSAASEPEGRKTTSS